MQAFRRSAGGWLAVALLAAVLAGCGGGTAKKSAGGSTPTPQPQVLRISLTQEPNSLNPLYTDMWSALALRDLYLSTGLIGFNDRNEPIAWVAKEIPSRANGGISADGKIITYRLREDARWSDGKPLTARDYVFTWRMIMSDRNTVMTREPFDAAVDKVEAKDNYTLVVTLKQPYAPWQARLFTNAGFNNAIPRHILEPVFAQEGSLDHAAWNRAPKVGAGPYVFKEWQRGRQLVFAANSNFWLGRPQVDQIIVKLAPDEAAQAAAVKNGEADLGALVSYASMAELVNVEAIDLLGVPAGFKESWLFNLSTDPKTAGHVALQDPNVRRAIVMAVDRDKICNKLLYGRTRPAVTFWDNTPYAALDVQAIPYDPEGAKQLLRHAGWRTGEDGIRQKNDVKLKLRYVAAVREVRQKAQKMVQDMLREVGIDVELIDRPPQALLGAVAEKGLLATGQYDIAQLSVGPAFPDPALKYTSWACQDFPSAQNSGGRNWQFLCDRQLDELLAAQAGAMDFDERRWAFQQMSRLVSDQVYWASMWNDMDWWAVSKKLQNVRISGAAPFWSIHEWSIKP